MLNKFLPILFACVWVPAEAVLAQQTSDTGSQANTAVTTEQHKDWAISCQNQNDVLENCRMFQRLVLEESNRVVLQMLVLPSRDKTDSQAVLVLPLGLYLPAGVKLVIDNGAPLDLVYDRCFSQGCTARAPLSSALLNSMKRGNVAQVVIREAAERDLILKVSLSGFTAAHKALMTKVAG